MKKYLEIENLSYTYHTLSGETTALNDISFSLDKGEFLAIVGPSGCGKSTLLSIIAGLLPASGGRIRLCGTPVEGHRREIGYMLQRDHLLEWRSTCANVTLGLEIQRKFTDDVMDRVHRMLETYGLDKFCDSKPCALSGGMRQRAALIRTLLLDPELLLLDEPFSALDYQTRLEVADDISGILRAEQKTSILVTHDIAEAISFADRVLVLGHRPATVKAVYDIKLSVEKRTPLASRSAREFADYFNSIWKELTINEETEK